MDLCPIATIYPELNISNHMIAIKYANLGPADPRQPSTIFWGDKMVKWQVKEGEARTRLCMNCAHYDNSAETMLCLANGPGGKVKASELPVTPKWADITGMPAAVCTRYNITCSALRTCDDWEDPCYDEDNANVRFACLIEDSEED
jgi:hypothetical protein